jgi:hypothetical protein
MVIDLLEFDLVAVVKIEREVFECNVLIDSSSGSDTIWFVVLYIINLTYYFYSSITLFVPLYRHHIIQ